jgi:hypothetical protein
MVKLYRVEFDDEHGEVFAEAVNLSQAVGLARLYLQSIDGFDHALTEPLSAALVYEGKVVRVEDFGSGH